MGKTDLVQFTIDLRDYSKSLNSPPRKVSLARRQKIADIVQQGIHNDIMVPVNLSGLLQCSRAQPNGEGRLCVEYRSLNAITRVSSYPLLRTEQALECLYGKTFYSTFDLSNAFWQIKTHPSPRKFLAFITSDGLYEWPRMPFGNSGAPVTQQRMIDMLLEALSGYASSLWN